MWGSPLYLDSEREERRALPANCRASLDGQPRAAVPTNSKGLDAVGALANQGKEFRTRFFFVAEAAQHGRGDGGGMLLFHAAHHHAEMTGFDDHANTLGLDYFLNGLGDLGGETLLNLKATGEQFDEPRNFAETDDAALGNIGDVDLAEKWQQVMFAEAEHFNVFDDDHLVVADGEERAFEQGLRIFLVSLSEEPHGFMHALGGCGEAFAFGVFTEADEHFVDQIFETGAGHGGRFLGSFDREWLHGHRVIE